MQHYSPKNLRPFARIFAGSAICVLSGILCSSCLFEQAHDPADTEPEEINFVLVNDSPTGRFIHPVWFGEHPARNGHFLVAEQGGNVFLLSPGDEGFERSLFIRFPVFTSGLDGLLSLVFHPDFLNNRKYYAVYNPVRGELLIEERLFDDSLLADAGSSREILRVVNEPLGHNGGDLIFGADGYLYIALGDGSTVNEFLTDSQDLRAWHGKLLRIDVDHPSEGLPYSVPPDNPFVNHPDSLVLPEIWAYGLRSPWRMHFSPDGRLVLVDVGHGRQDEVNVIEKGGNYGWRIMEGGECFNDENPLTPLDSCDTQDIIPPVAIFEHPAPFAMCLVGGEFFLGDPDSRLHGSYIIGDMQSSKVYALSNHEDEWHLDTLGRAPGSMSSFASDSQGQLYVIGYYDGRIYRMEHPHLAGTLNP